ncbi:MAG: HU family DNA-binding protein [Thermodesulfobacteriota bacterium]
MKHGDLVKAVAQRAEISQRLAREVLGIWVDELTTALNANERVAVPGLGIFTVKRAAGRVMPNNLGPSPARTITVPPRRQVRFKPSESLKKLVRGV